LNTVVIFFELVDPKSHVDANKGIISLYLPTGLVLNSLDRKIVKTGIRLRFDSSFILVIKSDTLLEKTNGIFTFPTFIYPTSTDEIMLTCANLSSARMTVPPDARIAEACLIPFANILLKQTADITHL
jgi:dUTPase